MIQHGFYEAFGSFFMKSWIPKPVFLEVGYRFDFFSLRKPVRPKKRVLGGLAGGGVDLFGNEYGSSTLSFSF